jgi:hypothetical protein|tara:strand:- start:14252 stop:14392 length:141 start_codon:yes stop_codon:yes gene_type:complete
MIPNWKQNGFKNKEEAMCKAIADVFLQYPKTVIIYKGEALTTCKRK